MSPLVINKDMTVIGGHQRLKVLIELGYTEIECIVVDLDKTSEKALNIALNKIQGDWDEEKLESLLKELKTENFDLDLTGFNSEEINDLLDDFFETTEDGFDVDKADESFYLFLKAFYTQMIRVLKPGGAYYIFHADTEGYNFRKALIDAGGQVKQNLIWVKNTFVLGRQDYQWKHEPCLYRLERTEQGIIL